MNEKQGKNSNSSKDNEVNSVSKESKCESSDGTSHDDLPIDDPALNSHILSLIMRLYLIFSEQFDHITSLTDPKDRCSISTNKSCNNGHNKSIYLIEIHNVKSIVDAICNCGDFELSLIVLQSGCIGQSDQIHEIIENKGKSSSKRELLGVMLEDEGDYVGETDVGGDKEEEEDS